MKLLTKEQEAAHYNATLKGGFVGGSVGLGVGSLGVFLASRRYPFFRQLTLPLKAFLVTSGGTFGGIVTADHFSRSFEREQNPIDREYEQRNRERAEADVAGKSFTQRAMDFGRKERYKIVGASWIASMIMAFSIVNRNKYLSGQQKLVQARVYAQFLTVGVLVATAVFEISDSKNETGRYETIKVLDPNDPEHKRYVEKSRPVESSDGDTLWKEMVAAEEQRLKEQEEDEDRLRGDHHRKQPKKKGGSSNGNGNGGSEGESKKKSKDDSKKDEDKKDDDKKDEGKKDEGKKDKGKKDEGEKDEGKDDKKEKDSGKGDDKKESKPKKKQEGGDEKNAKKDKSANDAKEKK